MKQLKRKCIVTHKIIDVNDLIRVVKLPDGSFEVNSNNQGRGAYVSRDKTLYPKIIKQKLLNRSFKTNVPSTIYEELRIELGAENER